MNLAAVAATAGGATTPATTTWSVSTPTARGYQAALFLRFDTQGLGAPPGDGLAIDAAGCQFQAAFQPLDYDALDAPPIPAAARAMSKDGQAVIVTLDGPREVLSVRLDPQRPVELHRADGPVQADKAAEAGGFTDVHFAIQPVGGGVITVNQVSAVTVRGQPANPRIGIAGPDGKSPAVFWPTPDATGQLSVNAAPGLAAALEAHLAERWAQVASSPTPPSHLDVALVVTSDMPCRIAISQFNVRVHRQQASFSPGDAAKRVLRFGGKRVEQQTTVIEIPGAATVTSASLSVSESFQAGAGVASVTGADLLDGGALARDRGVRITAADARSGGQRVTPAAAARIAGVALGVMALSPGTSLAVELQSDWRGLPSGKRIAAGATNLARAGEMQWAIVSLKDAAALSAEAFWILTTATKGAAVWLVEAGDDPPRLLEKPGGAWTEASRLDGQRALYRLLPPSPAANAGEDAQPPPPPVRLAIGDATVAGALQADGTRRFDIGPAMNAVLTAARAGQPPPVRLGVPLVFRAGGAGSLTVYPPRIAYDV